MMRYDPRLPDLWVLNTRLKQLDAHLAFLRQYQMLPAGILQVANQRAAIRDQLVRRSLARLSEQLVPGEA